MTAPTPPPAARRPRVPPFHPVLFAAFPVLALYAHNVDRVPAQQAVPLLGLSVLVTLIVWAVLAGALRSIGKAAAIASVAALSYGSYGHVQALVPHAARWLTAGLIATAVIAAIVALLRAKKPLLDTTSVLNLASVALVVPSLWTVGGAFWRAYHGSARTGQPVAMISHRGDSAQASEHGKRRRTLVPAPAHADRPDIYYIILDAYGRADRLRQFYGYDNTPFLNALKSRGFYIANSARANYDQTSLCLASSLNMTYLDDLANSTGPGGAVEACREMIDDNAVATDLSRLGYHYVYVGSGIDEVNVETADVTLNEKPAAPVFEQQAAGMAVGGASAVPDPKPYDLHRARILGVFDGLNTAAALPYPKFVFAHVLAPHPPFVLGEHGEAVYPNGPLTFADGSWLAPDIGYQNYINGYISQLKCVNALTLRAIDAILKRSKQRPIIIVQGDHGSRMKLDWEHMERTDLREPFCNLNAYLVPPKVRRGLYQHITPVNSFRVLLSREFGLKLAPIADRSFYSTAAQPYAFTEVTSLIDLDPVHVTPLRTSAPPAPTHGVNSTY